jgi:transcriptional regulator with XRE-family HTH domain
MSKTGTYYKGFLDKVTTWRLQNPIRLYRTQHDLTLQNFADLIGEKYHTIYRWESGISSPSDDQLATVEKTFPGLRRQISLWQEQKPQRKE